MIATAIEFVGLGCLVVAAAIVHPALGLAAFGGLLLVVGYFIESREE